jgi:hypothetical protein
VGALDVIYSESYDWETGAGIVAEFVSLLEKI